MPAPMVSLLLAVAPLITPAKVLLAAVSVRVWLLRLTLPVVETPFSVLNWVLVSSSTVPLPSTSTRIEAATVLEPLSPRVALPSTVVAPV